MNTSTLISALVSLTLLPLPAPAAPTAPARLPVDVPALHWAAAGGDEENARALLLQGADVNVSKIPL